MGSGDVLDIRRACETNLKGDGHGLMTLYKDGQHTHSRPSKCDDRADVAAYVEPELFAEPVDTQSELGVLAGGLIWIEVEVPVDPFVNEGNEDLKRHSQQEEDNDEPAPARRCNRRGDV